MAGSIYTTGGTVQAGGGIYLSRKADDELLQLCREGQFAYVLTSRQMGKSSLMVQTAQRLDAEDITSVIIDLTKIGTNVTPEQWYLGLLTEIDESLMLDTDIFDWWEEHSHLGVTQRLTRFFEEILLSEVDGRIVLFVDEIDTTLSLGFTDDFFIAIRYFYTARAQKEQLGRLSVVLIGVASPGDLISDPQRTPFNVGRRVDLTDFSQEEAQGFAAGLSAEPNKAREILHWVMQWTGGHPYLTQRLCQGVVESERTEWSAAAVERLVEDLFLRAGVRNDNNLLFVRDMLVKRTPDENGSVYEVLITYDEIWRERQLVLDEEQSLIKSHLKLAGVVRRDETKGSLHVSNAIYRGVFDQGWVKEHLPVNWVKRLQRARATIGTLAAVTIVALSFGSWALVERSNSSRALAREARALANLQVEQAKTEQEKQNAEENAEEARNNADLAEEKALEADEQAQEAEKQAKRAQEQTVIAEQRRAEAQEATRRTEAARVAEAEQRKAAEAARLAEAEAAQFAMAREAEANNQRARAEKQTEIATVQALWAQSKALLLAEKPIESMIIALKAAQSVEFSQNPEAKPPALAALQQVTYPDKDFILQLSPTFRERNRLEHYQNVVLSVAFSNDGNTLASTGLDGTIKLWDRNSGIELASLQGQQGYVLSVAFSNDGNTLASVGEDGTVKLWDRNSGTELASLQGQQDSVSSVAFSNDGNTLASASWDGTVKLWDINSGTELTSLQGQQDSVVSMAFSNDGNTLTSASLDGTVKLWDINSGTELASLQGHQGRVWSVAFSNDGNTLASASEDSTVKLWDINSGTELDSLQGHQRIVSSVAFSNDGNTLASASWDGTIKLWNRNSGTELDSLQGYQRSVSSVAFSNDGNTLASVGEDGIKLWDINSGTELDSLQGQQGSVSSVAFSNDGNTLASASKDGIKLWDINSGTELASLQSQQGRVVSMAFSNDGNTLTSASSDRTVKLWDINSGTELDSLQGHQGYVFSVALSNDGNTLASASLDGTVKLWDINSGTELASLQGHQGYVLSVAFSNDGNTLASAGSDGTVKLWDRNLDSLIARSCDWLGGYLTNNPDGQRIAEKEGICQDYLPYGNVPSETLFGRFLDWIGG